MLKNVSRETIENINAYEELIRKWNPSINLVAKSTLGNLRTRHIGDSLQLVTFLPTSTQCIADLGSGGGLPGVVIAIVNKEKNPSALTVLVESDARKAAFLRTVSIELSLNTKIVNERIEQADAIEAEVVLARALAPLEKLLDYVNRHMRVGGIAIIPKGRRYEEEVAMAQRTWSFNLKQHNSLVDSESRILELSNLKRRN